MSEACNHAVGTATVEYYPDILRADDTGDSASENSFCAFAYCPHCGKEIAHEAKIVADRIQENWEKHWIRYGEVHGQEELKRARKSL